MRETAATIFARFQSDRARVESRQTTHSGLRTAQRTGAAASRPRRAIHGDAVSLSPVLQACGVRQFKYAPGLERLEYESSIDHKSRKNSKDQTELRG